MSTFPQRVDSLAYIPSITSSDAGAPRALLSAINEALRSAESHLGFSIQSGGDIQADGTFVPAGPGRRLLPLSGTWAVTSAQNGFYGIYVPLSEILDTSCFSDALSNGNAHPNLLASVPIFSSVQRRGTGQRLSSAVVLNPAGQSLLALCLPRGLPDATFASGEILDIFTLFWGSV